MYFYYWGKFRVVDILRKSYLRNLFIFKLFSVSITSVACRKYVKCKAESHIGVFCLKCNINKDSRRFFDEIP